MSSKQILLSENVLQQYGTGELAIQLSTASPHLLILSARAGDRIGPVVERIKSAAPHVATRFLEMDLGDMSSIETAIANLHDISKIDHLACVAGVMVPPYRTTKDGFETQFGVNYLGHFMLVDLLLSKIKEAGNGSSITIVASTAVRIGKVDLENIRSTVRSSFPLRARPRCANLFQKGETCDSLMAYCQSNAARVMFAKALADRLAGHGIRVFSIDPGAVQTGIQRHFTPEFGKRARNLALSKDLTDIDGKPFKLPPITTKSEGAATIITGMIDPRIGENNGAFLHDNAVADDELHIHILDKKNQAELWKLTEQMISESQSRNSTLN
ncbi:short-chain dehydrogenase, putative [Talaromyces stipitatus ATCC 10500]|uniref:Short-chain dehydrogenase, putative n=1 Tax=Talaromyces stipitatus (strain ATCC 10500 / CBS 375.48 / QM 6759 / NRRL 1006) TaxID=441959 RepID=B8MUA3_TALSN|nr:short-chain dehydrogenase, putative [Talaromyces stipitatus ATCC 10500]EED11607.1 short-chain dehydrogenase, putative [Talaromyces stipitatus ATCC 10500]